MYFNKIPTSNFVILKNCNPMNVEMEEPKIKSSKKHESNFISTNGNYQTIYDLSNAPLIKAVAKGYMDFESVEETYAHFDMLLNVVQMRGHHSPYYLCIDYSKVNGADKQSRDYFKKRVDRLFAEEILAAAAVISPSFFIRTIGTLYRKINPNLNYRFFRNEYEAMAFLQNTNISDPINGYQNLLNTDREEGTFYFLDKKVNFFKKKEWQYAHDQVKVHISLLNNQCILMQCTGKPNLNQIKANVATSKAIVESFKNQKLCLVLDISKMDMPSLKVKKFAAEVTSETKDLWTYRYIVTSSRLKTFYQIIKLFHSKALENSKAVSTLPEALKFCIQQKKEDNSQQETLSKKEDLMQLSKVELADKIRKLEMNQMRTSNSIFKTLSRITWDSSFTPAYLKIPEEKDPFFDLVNCVNILQDDIFSMMNELKEFNRSLERQVRERTEQLNQQNDELRKINTEMDNFVYSVSHDLKAPLASILGLVDLTQLENDPEKVGEYFALIKKSLIKLNNFIMDLLHLSRNNRTALSVHEINFNNLLDEIFEELNYMENSEQIRKEVKVNASAVFYNDDKRIAIVLKNLLSNAIKYSITTYREASIKIFININAIECKIIIVDNGIGIAQEHQEKIFDMFYRGTELSNGTGIGLHIVKEIMTKLNGKISFESTFGEGSTFHLSIPNLQLDN